MEKDLNCLDTELGIMTLNLGAMNQDLGLRGSESGSIHTKKQIFNSERIHSWTASIIVIFA